MKDRYPIVDKPGEGVLRIRTAITDVEPGSPVKGAATTIIPVGATISLIKKSTTGSDMAVGRASMEIEMAENGLLLKKLSITGRKNSECGSIKKGPNNFNSGKEVPMKKYLVIIAILTMALGCATPQTKTEEGTRKGLAIGAIGGAVLGQIFGGDKKATILGAGIGAIAGGAIGSSYGKKMDEQEATMRRQLAAIEEANVQRNADVLAVTLMSDMMFDIGSATLKPGSKEQISRISSVLTKYTDTSIFIAGHTDSTGSATLNQQLSELRAINVKLTIVEQGVHPSRIKTVGFGASAPIADNGSEEGRRLNRRVVITISEQQA